MLPPIDPAVLERNPRFKTLYEDLAKEKLNADASTKDIKKQKLIDQARKDLDTRRTEIAKTQILKSSLNTINARAVDLPDELHEVITIVTAQLNGQIPSSEREILQEDINYFIQHIEPISHALSAHLSTTALQLCKIANPQDPDPSIPSLLTPTNSTTTTDLATALSTQRTRLADLGAAVLAAQTQLMQLVIRLLEQAVHGSVARSTRARAEHLAAVARGVGLKLRILTTQHQPPADVLAALSSYSAHLESGNAELQHRHAIAEDRLRAFEEAGGRGRGGGGVMREIARRYAEVEEEIARVRGELGRLEGGA